MNPIPTYYWRIWYVRRYDAARISAASAPYKEK
jgi:hypothetical protein